MDMETLLWLNDKMRLLDSWLWRSGFTAQKQWVIRMRWMRWAERHG